MHFKEIIQQVKDRRESLQLTQATVAELSGVGLRTLKQFESGKGNPTLTTVQQIADALGMEVTLKIKDLSTDQ